MFANKFEMKAFPEAVDCLEQWHRTKCFRQAEVPILSAWRLSARSDRDAERERDCRRPETPLLLAGRPEEPSRIARGFVRDRERAKGRWFTRGEKRHSAWECG
ncbi:hypothetical protein AAFF_G00048810 [Aldrovandia affinis]|uniref:Uncharacterized protein n=1 Tax=Aldrovandia affinis TaxID=143900 RepID=A0AAD7R1T4_9TELE|nr:hypothetical protein AAFF_G00048810 [Aldrovandia affinis]